MNSEAKGFRYLHTTEVAVSVTASQMMAILGLLGATNISMQITNGEPSGMTFSTTLGTRVVHYRIPVRWEHIHQDLLNQAKSKRGTWAQRDARLANALAQAKRTAWRLALEWLKVQAAFVQNGVRQAAEVFLSDMIIQREGESETTVGELLINHGGMKLLGGPS
jgi:pSer/pThr/pTyr-binding forkhead associated (FHA) protein